MKLLFVILLLHCLLCVSSKYSDWARAKHGEQFNRVCMKYAWVREYLQKGKVLGSNTNQKYAIFVFDDHHTRARKGGLGDRLGGLITTFAYALRSGRTFLVEANKDGLARLFKPRQLPNADLPERSWGDWKWANYQEKISHLNKTYLWCVNPKPSQTFCALDSGSAFDQFKIVRLRINRSYLCRWAQNTQLPANEELRALLNVTTESNLFEIGGCMLQLALAPTDYLWSQLDKVFERHPTPSYQVGFHYRCGDHNYKGAHLHPEMANHMQCSVQPGVPWNGTHAVDELSLASPIDSGTCGSKALSTLDPGLARAAVAYIASDSADSSAQIRSSLAWPATVAGPQGCHIDFDPSPECAQTTLLHWFALTLSDHSVFQSYLDPDLNAPLPSSSFSRYAMIYSLNEGRQLQFASSTCDGRGSSSHWNSSLSRVPQGNWVCTGGKIY